MLQLEQVFTEKKKLKIFTKKLKYFIHFLAEENLAKLHPQPGYPLLLLTLLQQSTVSSHILQAAAVEFKNFVGRNWAVSVRFLFCLLCLKLI